MRSELLRISIVLNGVRRDVEVEPHHTLLDVVRNRLGLTGTKECCDAGECGACTVLMNGRAVTSCLVLAAEADESAITTIEGLSSDGRLDALQQALVESGAVQCGFCIPGMVMAAKALLLTVSSPTEQQIRAGLAGNLCRCGAYSKIVEAVRSAGTLHARGQGDSE